MSRFKVKGNSYPFFNAELNPREETKEINILPRGFSRELDFNS